MLLWFILALLGALYIFCPGISGYVVGVASGVINSDGGLLTVALPKLEPVLSFSSCSDIYLLCCRVV